MHNGLFFNDYVVYGLAENLITLEAALLVKHSAIGFDIGHSAVKLAYTVGNETRTMIFPSVVIPAFKITDEAESRRALADTVVVDGQQYFVGDTAVVQGGRNASSCLDENWIGKPEYRALMQAAINKLEADGAIDSAAMIMMGLPTHLHGRQKDELRTLGESLFGPGKEIKVAPQPIGAYQFNMLGENGRPGASRSFTEESWGVIEIGHFSTDFLLMQKSRWVEHASGACNGMKDAAASLQNILADELSITRGLRECEQAIREGKIKRMGEIIPIQPQVDKALKGLAQQIIETANKKLEEFVDDVDGIVLAGGGAPVIAEVLCEKWPHVRMVANPRFAVAEGFRRFGLGILNARGVA